MHYSCLNESRRASQFIIYLGNKTLSMTWITPLSQTMSVVTTVAPLISTLPFVNFTSTNFPLTIAQRRLVLAHSMPNGLWFFLVADFS